MAARNKENQINLLPKVELESSIFGRILTWTLSTFRIIVIATEMVVIISFLSRFWLDAKNSNLNDLMKQKEAAILAQADFEKEFKDLQVRLSIFSNLEGSQKASGILGKISPYLPADAVLSSYSYNEDSIDLRGRALSEVTIAQFISNLSSSNLFNEIKLSSVTSSQEDASQLEFTLSLTPKKEG